MSQHRIVSLIPSATEIVAVLGVLDRLVGRSHECDYPASVRALPICTAPKFNPTGTSAEVHQRVTDILQSALSVYQVDTGVLEQLKPTHILTQAQCDVCAVNLTDVEAAVAQLTQVQPQIISLQPNTLAEIWADIRHVAAVLGVESEQTIAALQMRIAACDRSPGSPQALAQTDRPTVACIEWSEPLMAAGNWIPELVTLAGGVPLFATIGQHSPWLEWDALVAADPDIVILMPCGYDLAKTQEDVKILTRHPQWQTLRAVQTHHVYATDGNAYFNRPGPRLVDSLEILSEILHPSSSQCCYEGQGWLRVKM